MVRSPGLLGRTAQTVVRTAVIAGTATAASGAVAGRQAGAAPAQGIPAGGDASHSGLSVEAMDQLKQFADLRAQETLSEEEFSAQKARILG
jgi:hypothetical protein